MTDGLERDIKDYLQNLTTELVAIKGFVNSIETKSALHAQTLGAIESHMREINGSCREHANILADHDKAIALLEQRTVCALDRDCHLREGVEKLPVVADVIPKVVENTSILTLNVRENWLKWLIVFLVLAFTSVGGNALVNWLSK